MANRQQRRHPPKDIPQISAAVPTLLQQLKEPEIVADMTVLEVNEITARDKELDFIASELTRLAEQQQHFARLQAILTNEKRSFIRDLCTNKGLSTQDVFVCDIARGIILRTAAQVPIQVEPVVEEPGPQGEAEASEATDAPYVDPDKPS